jgi:membrane-bound serine protease (ClpP class)
MTAVGLVLLLIGVLLVVAETHVPGGTLGVVGGLALVAGGISAIVAAGGPVALAVPVGIGLGLLAGGWTLSVSREAARGPRRRIRAGREALCGRIGVVRRWAGTTGQVFVDGALWRARAERLDGLASDRPLHEGDHVVVEYVNGLTLCVRAAEEWEL